MSFLSILFVFWHRRTLWLKIVENFIPCIPSFVISTWIERIIEHNYTETLLFSRWGWPSRFPDLWEYENRGFTFRPLNAHSQKTEQQVMYQVSLITVLRMYILHDMLSIFWTSPDLPGQIYKNIHTEIRATVWFYFYTHILVNKIKEFSEMHLIIHYFDNIKPNNNIYVGIVCKIKCFCNIICDSSTFCALKKLKFANKVHMFSNFTIFTCLRLLFYTCTSYILHLVGS